MAYRQFPFAGRLGIVGDHVPLTEQAFPGGESHFGPDRDSSGGFWLTKVKNVSSFNAD
ncbi:hypothetical protein [Bradyrhizobium sp. CCBAU 51765]|uniref:hypothetical protein n=1 Tax=Bradyrhizobium sp. CCBAU 51765 TaxID=1325102 RepID=UPI001886DA53|nr:hypothetical protein [Bradyrhizobium sp. CCBAU 51765]